MRNTRIHLAAIHSLPGIGPEGRKVKIPTYLPIVFSAGPIGNAPPWHDEALRIALARNEKVFFVSPVRSVAEDLVQYVEKDAQGYGTFHRQRALEQYYMYLAALSGCIFFWLCKEQLPKKNPDKVYGHMSTFELGKWIERKKLHPATRLVIGTDGDFPEWSTLEFEIKTELPGLPIYGTLAQTVHAALDIATR